MNTIQTISQKFKTLFNSTPIIVKSPGRVNLIGEHIDYNGGFVLPAAINKYVYLAIQKRADDEIHLYSEDYQDNYISNINKLVPSGKLWPDYILGVVKELNKQEIRVGGFNAVFSGDIPEGAGLSSSAALECAAAYSLNKVFALDLSQLEIALTGQAAENNFIGVKCGLMDQFASVFGKKNQLIKLDCESLDYEYIPFKVDGYKLVLFDTAVKHSLASSEYNTRRQECEEGLRIITQNQPEITSFRQVSREMVQNYLGADERILKRCLYVVSEIERVESACLDLLCNDIKTFGERMFQTHEGLRDQYEVSCPELDFLVDAVSGNADVIGARMMGGGFGGCTINIVRSESVNDLIASITEEYNQRMNKDLKSYIAEPGDGTSLVLHYDYISRFSF